MAVKCLSRTPASPLSSAGEMYSSLRNVQLFQKAAATPSGMVVLPMQMWETHLSSIKRSGTGQRGKGEEEKQAAGPWNLICAATRLDFTGRSHISAVPFFHPVLSLCRLLSLLQGTKADLSAQATGVARMLKPFLPPTAPCPRVVL